MCLQKALHKDNGDGKLDKNEYLLYTTNSSNPVLKIGDTKLPVDKNLLVKSGKTHELEGIVVYAPVTARLYIPSEVIYTGKWDKRLMESQKQ